MAIGLVLLAISRPFEGLLLCIPVGVATLIRLSRQPPVRNTSFWRIVAPAAGVLVPFMFALGYYNDRVTGNPLRLPYMEHARQYGVARVLLLQDSRPEPEYRHSVLRDFYVDSEYATYRIDAHVRRLVTARKGQAADVGQNVSRLWSVRFTVRLAVRPAAQPDHALCPGACVFVFGFIAALETWGFSHYTAPVAGLVYLVVVQGFRCISFFAARVDDRSRIDSTMARRLHIGPRFTIAPSMHEAPRPWAAVRAGIESELRSDGHRHLVVVRYGPEHKVHEEWVYNEADIDGAQIVWAREMGPEMQARLFDYFADRTVWLLEENGAAPRLTRSRDSLSSSRSRAK